MNGLRHNPLYKHKTEDQKKLVVDHNARCCTMRAQVAANVIILVLLLPTIVLSILSYTKVIVYCEMMDRLEANIAKLDAEMKIQRSNIQTPFTDHKEETNFAEQSQNISHIVESDVNETVSLETSATRGLQGQHRSTGKEGSPGPPGPPGPQGPRGPSGDPGNDGRYGLPGLNGLPGDVGTPGLDGLPGQKGSKGDKGIDGLPGLPGAKGAKGCKGNNGSPGLPGLPGFSGMKGSDRLPGPNGQKGDLGPRGVKGFKGEKGQNGFHETRKTI